MAAQPVSPAQNPEAEGVLRQDVVRELQLRPWLDLVDFGDDEGAFWFLIRVSCLRTFFYWIRRLAGRLPRGFDPGSSPLDVRFLPSPSGSNVFVIRLTPFSHRTGTSLETLLKSLSEIPL